MLIMSRDDWTIFEKEWKNIIEKLKNSGQNLKRIKIAKTRETDRY